jgi:MFS family permease
MILADPIGNVGQTASLYSQVAGVLAGFAFTVLVGFMARSAPDADGDAPAQESERAAIAAVLFSTLAALIICAVLYGILAGGLPDSGNAQSGLLLYGPAFSLAVLSMFYATGLAALSYQHLHAMLEIVRFLVCVTTPALSIVLIAGAANDICASARGRCMRTSALNPEHPFGFGMVLAMLVGTLSATALQRYKHRPLQAVRRQSLAGAAVWVVLTAALAAAVLAVVLDLEPAAFVVSHWALYLVEVCTAVLLQSFALLAVHSLRPRLPTPTNPQTLTAASAAAWSGEHGEAHDMP